ncbi:MAG: hypothetical protein ACO20G_02300 [Ilumatobacteraceae bacterium]|nr:hypothetical protein [Actinomycetota bacterium]
MTPRALAAVGAVIMRPTLWPVALRQSRRLVLPALLPTSRGAAARDYLRFRLTTQYGASGRSLQGRDVVNYLQWCRAMGSIGARPHR